MTRFAVLLTAAVTACDRPGAGPVDSGQPPLQGCPVAFSYRAQQSASSVSVVGEWNAFERPGTPLRDASGQGKWSGTLTVPPGNWAYSVLENGGEVPLDSDARFVRYVQGRALPSLRVARCDGPRLFLADGALTRLADGVSADLSVLDGDQIEVSLQLPDGTSQTSQLSVSAGQATFEVRGLAAGKYTARLTAKRGGQRSDPLLLPFWVEAQPFSFRDSPLYMLMIDRFRNGDPSNDSPGTATARFEGGDLQGVEAAIREGYFDRLKVKALWLSPWQTQPTRAFPDGAHTVSGYHGYWPVKARAVDPRFGGNEALARMVREAHRHGIRIVMDAVLNHVHEEHEYFVDPARKAWFRTGCVCGSSASCGWDNAAQTCLFRSYMPDVDWTNNEAAEQMVADVLWWLEEFDLDGIRVDAVKHVEEAAIINLTNRVRERFEGAGTDYFMFGETFSSDPGTLKRYIGARKLDGQLNFPLFMRMPEAVFGRDDQGLQQVRSATQASLGDFAGATMVDFVGNHDVARFITKADPSNRDRAGSQWENLPGAPVGQAPYDRLFLALAHLMTVPAVPLIYYGDEYGEFGGSDPDNRHRFRADAALSGPERAQLERTVRLLEVRAQLKGLQRGPWVELWCNTESWGQGAGNLMAYARTDSDPRHTAVVVLNLTPNTWTGVSVTVPPSFGYSGAMVKEHLTGQLLPMSGSSFTVDVPGRSAAIVSMP